MADNVAHRLGDTAPELDDKLWNALKNFNEAETDEQYALVALSCRRSLEYVINQLFPPIKQKIDGHKLDKESTLNQGNRI